LQGSEVTDPLSSGYCAPLWDSLRPNRAKLEGAKQRTRFSAAEIR
jgi:hypothetical protein